MDGSREPHSVSIKVLRLAKPLLSQQFPFNAPEKDSSISFDAAAALDTDHGSFDNGFILNSALTLPSAFGAAYVGETFSCTLCVNNELSGAADRQVSNVRVGAEMQTPSGNVMLELQSECAGDVSSHLTAGHSLQRIVRFDLREEGNHTLAVMVSYNETMTARDHSASGGRVRSFRKLYQFVARPCLNVRTKISPLALGDGEEVRSLALEAQLDNVADGSVLLNSVTFSPKPAFTSTSLNWDTFPGQANSLTCPVLAPTDVMQVAFLVEQQDGGPSRELTRDGRIILGQLSIGWRTAMGDIGFLSTGWLTTKRR